MQYTLGLDIGITSVGWAVLNNDDERIEDLGVRTFQGAENPKDGTSLNTPRRMARGLRRRLRRRSHRMKRLVHLFERRGLITEAQFEDFFARKFILTPYDLRSVALERLVSAEEWLRIIYHVTKHRGFKSNRKSETASGEGGEIRKNIERNQAELKAQGYRTIGEMLSKDVRFADNKRNKAGSYLNTIARVMQEDELKILFAMQRQFGNLFADEKFEADCLIVFNSQRHYAEGNQVLKMVGTCTFEEGELRAPKAAYSAERFTLLQKINNLRLVLSGVRIELTEEQKANCVDLAYKQSKLTYKQMRIKLQIASEYKFNGLRYSGKNGDEDPEGATFVELKNWHMIRKTLEKYSKTYWLNISTQPELLDNIACALTYYKADDQVSRELAAIGIEAPAIDELLNISCDKVMHLSLKAIRKILTYLEQNIRYDVACEQVGYCHYQPKAITAQSLLPVVERADITNPVVFRAVTQTRKVVNAIIRKYGKPEFVNIELARDLGKPKLERDKIKKGQDEYRKFKEDTARSFKEHFAREPHGDQLLKWRLWREQGSGYCAYSQRYLEPLRLFDDGYTQIDHIIPFSRCLDDGMANKVLVTVEENQLKGNSTPYEYFGSNENRWHRYEEWVNSTIRSWTKRQKLLRKEYDRSTAEEMKERHLNDTRYICRFMKNFIEHNLQFSDSDKIKRVRTINGQMTAFLRTKWKFHKVRAEGDLHHALDAAVVAGASDKLVRRLTMFSKANELYHYKYKRLIHIDEHYIDPDTGEILDSGIYQNIDTKYFPKPWEHFCEELKARMSVDPTRAINANSFVKSKYDGVCSEIKPIFVSRMPKHKIGGTAHKETVRSAKKLVERITSLRTEIKKICIKKRKGFELLENMAGKERDYQLYDALKNRLELFGDKAENAFAEPFYKPTNDGSRGPIVRSIKIERKGGEGGVLINNGIADNAPMIRVDVFEKAGKFYLVPIYVADRVKQILPNKAIVQGKSRNEWPEMDDSYRFKFSLFSNDLVRVLAGGKETFGYYKSTDSSNGSIAVDAHDNNPKLCARGLGVKLAKEFEKYQVDVLGNYFPVRGEKRCELA
ncbi:MAG: type II CRISPR RNA-guided endonuclease Cas9 [Negativicutes bacterium]|jgi:CRISPR-associated endonuclease Csn1